MKKAVIFGASNLGNIAYNILKDKYDICFFSDNDKNKWDKEFCGLKIVEPMQLLNYKEYNIIIASMYYDQISTQLKNMNLEEIYVFSYCDANDKTYKKRYSVDKMCNLDIYKDIKLNEEFKNQFIKNFNFIYNKESDNYIYLDKNDLVNKNRKVLVISYIFPPIGGGGVQRTLKFVKYLKEYGWEPIILTVGKDFWHDNKDYSLMEDVPKGVKVIRIDHNISNSEQLTNDLVQELINLYFGVVNDKKIMEKYLKYISENNGSNRGDILIPDICITWVNEALKNIENSIDFKDIDLIYTTSCPYSDNILGYFIKQKYNLPWVADFRDEWTNHAYFSGDYGKTKIKYEIEREMEKNTLELADIILTVTSIGRENYINNFNIKSDKVITITNGYDEQDFVEIENTKCNDKFTIVFNGSLYKEINPINIILSLNQLIEEGKIKEEYVEIKLVGTVDISIKESLIKHDKYYLIRYLGYLPHGLSLEIASAANILLLILGKSEKVKSVYTGKIFEYLRLYKPILSLSPKGSLVEQLLNDTNSGKNIEYDNIHEIKKYILELYGEWLQNNYKMEVNKKLVEQYERKNLTKKLSEVFNTLIK